MHATRENILIHNLLEREDQMSMALFNAEARLFGCYDRVEHPEKLWYLVEDLTEKLRQVREELCALVGEEHLPSWRETLAQWKEGRGTDYPSNISYALAVLESGAAFFAGLKPVFKEFARFLARILKTIRQDDFLTFVREKLRAIGREVRTAPPWYTLPRPPVAPLAPPL